MSLGKDVGSLWKLLGDNFSCKSTYYPFQRLTIVDSDLLRWFDFYEPDPGV